jgi:hypothetical protein
VGEITPAVTGSRGEEIAGGGRRVTWPGRRGPRASERKRKRVYRFGIELGGLRACFLSGPNRFPEVQFQIFISLSSFLFLFSISFVTFAYILQTMSNQFLIFYKIQINNTKQ